jgi:hypothetical protein
VPGCPAARVQLGNASVAGNSNSSEAVEKEGLYPVLLFPEGAKHFTPTYSSWINMVERWFGKLTEETLRRGSHCSTAELQAAIEDHIAGTNADPKPFVWTKTADRGLRTLGGHKRWVDDMAPVVVRVVRLRVHSLSCALA